MVPTWTTTVFCLCKCLSESMYNILTYGSADDYNLINNHCNSLKKVLINYILEPIKPNVPSKGQN